MKVRELISALQSEQQEAEAVISCQEQEMEFCDITNIASVFIKKREHPDSSNGDYTLWGDTPAVYLSRS